VADDIRRTFLDEYWGMTEEGDLFSFHWRHETGTISLHRLLGLNSGNPNYTPYQTGESKE
jgi:hypothetical protein